MSKPNLLHARFWKYTGNHPNGHDCERHDPHGFGLPLISGMAYLIDGGEVWVNGVSLSGAIARHHKGNSFGHQIHVAANREQWDAVKEYLKSI